MLFSDAQVILDNLSMIKVIECMTKKFELSRLEKMKESRDNLMKFGGGIMFITILYVLSSVTATLAGLLLKL